MHYSEVAYHVQDCRQTLASCPMRATWTSLDIVQHKWDMKLRKKSEGTIIWSKTCLLNKTHLSVGVTGLRFRRKEQQDKLKFTVLGTRRMRQWLRLRPDYLTLCQTQLICNMLVCNSTNISCTFLLKVKSITFLHFFQRLLCTTMNKCIRI